ncbi:MAG TPA: PAC2 family protein [Mycobacteriales bacterium]|nr:PAC2 family protein [Mycobacteriales bacterium]
MTALPPEELFTLAEQVPGLTGPDGRGPVLIEMLDGFVDAGGGRRLAREHLLAAVPSVVVARFDVDLLFDYRARRPPMLFAQDHWSSYEAPQLEIRALHDERNTPLLLLLGAEPDVMWGRFVSAVELLVRRLGVRLTIGTNAIPMAVPHTRPVGLTAHGSRKDLIAEHPAWVGTVQVPGSASALLEHRLGAAGLDALGFAVHVPHYLAQAAYPPAAETLLRTIARVADLQVPLAALETSSAEAISSVDQLVGQSDELSELVRTLEGQYDAFVAGRSGGGADEPTLAGGGPLPSADELGAELERFLADQSKGRDDPGATGELG